MTELCMSCVRAHRPGAEGASPMCPGAGCGRRRGVHQDSVLRGRGTRSEALPPSLEGPTMLVDHRSGATLAQILRMQVGAFSRIGLKFADTAKHWRIGGQTWPKLGRLRSNSGPDNAMFANAGPNSTKFRPNLLGRIWAKTKTTTSRLPSFTNIDPNSAKFSRNRLILSRNRPNPG